MRHVVTALVIALMLMLRAHHVRSQELRIGIIDFYGLRQVSESQAREALTVSEGDAITMGGNERPAFVTESEHRLRAVPGVLSARLNVVCCDGGRAILYVGIEEPGTPTLHFRTAPRGNARLPSDVMQAGEEFFRALMQAVSRGDSGEDNSKGHALANEPATRAVQERFISYAARDLKRFRDVLRHSSDANHRALAALILGYAPDKRAVIRDLVYGVSDPSEEVRNNAMRALGVIATFASRSPDLKLQVPTAPLVDLVNSPVWSDRNKASFVLLALSARALQRGSRAGDSANARQCSCCAGDPVSRDPQLMASLRNRALGSLIEMARWKSEGHAFAAFCLLGRVSGMSEDAIQAAWSRGDREAVIDAALKQ